MIATDAETDEVCPCGHGPDHHMVSADAHYSVLGWLRLFIGISTRPLSIDYRCRRCDVVVRHTEDVHDLATYY